jgi:fluoride exporter
VTDDRAVKPRSESELTEPVEPDVDPPVPARRRSLGAVLAVVALGGGLGAVARYGLSELWPTQPGAFPWATFVVNTVGCLLIGMLMVLVTDVWSAHRLARPFLGVGVLGGFTTFSTYTAEAQALLRPGTVPLAFTYLAGTVAAALLAVIVGVRATRAVVRS